MREPRFLASVLVGMGIMCVGNRRYGMAEGVERGRVLGYEVAYDYAHGAVAKESAGRIVVSSGDCELIAGSDRVAAGLEESDNGNVQKVALVIHFCGQNGDLFVRQRKLRS